MSDLNIPKHYITIEGPEEFGYLINDLQTAKYVSFDTETTGLDIISEVFGCSISVDSPTNAVVTNEKNPPRVTYWYRFDYGSEDMNELMIDVIREIFTTDKYNVIMHHGSFDMRVVRKTFGIEFINPNFNDTMIMAKLFQHRFPNGRLKDLATRCLNRSTNMWELKVEQWFRENKIKNEDRRYDELPDLIVFPYASADSELTMNLFFELKNYFRYEDKKLVELYKLERRLVIPVADMEYRGALVDIDYFTNLKSELERQAEEIDQFFLARLGKKINLNSPAQVSDLLFTDGPGCLDLLPINDTASGKGSTRAEDLEMLMRERKEGSDEAEVLSRVMQSRTIDKWLGSFIDPILTKSIPDDEGYPTIHTNYTQIIATGRFSSSKINLQQIPNDNFSRSHAGVGSQSYSIRRGFICPPDFYYLKADYAQFELRLLGNVCKDPLFLKMVLDGIDMHSWLAAYLYHDECEQMFDQWRESDSALADAWVEAAKSDFSKTWNLSWRYWAITSKANTRLKQMRTMVKVCSFAIYYGAGAAKVSETQMIPLQEAQRLKEICFTTFKTLDQWRRETSQRGEHEGLVYTLFGRPIPIETKRAWTMAVNNTIQGSTADILKHAMVDIYYNKLRNLRSRMVMTIHDELQFYIYKDELEIIREIKNSMEQRYLPESEAPLVMEAEFSIGSTNWAECKDVHLETLGI